jgi:DNA-binding protein HU-beta/integration host factor subunit beta|tara:strand:+ start:2548 stop:2829 length:282 start_codon:yes stop_codon:yes gene_type:complete
LSRIKLIKKLKEKNPQLNKLELESSIDVFSKTVSDALISGKNVEIRGLGRWYLRKLKENFNARNPSTNELIYKPERVKVRFRSSKKLNKRINE